MSVPTYVANQTDSALPAAHPATISHEASREHHRENAAPVCAKRQSHADLSRPPRDRKGNRPVQSQRRQQHGQDAEQSGERGEQLILRERPANHVRK